MPSSRRSVAVIASSGGGTATQGHTDPESFLRTIDEQLQLIDADLRYGLFVGLAGGKGMDHALPSDRASLYQIIPKDSEDSVFECRTIKRGTLPQVNVLCQKLQEQLAKGIRQGNVHGLICISCHTTIFRETLEAAAAMLIPVTGSGGTSLAKAAAMYQLHLVGNAGGSVATTSWTRAVSYTYALASHWKVAYRPWSHAAWQNQPSWRSVLNASLPTFWGVCLAKAFLRTIMEWQGDVQSYVPMLVSVNRALEEFVLPAACSVLMATSYGNQQTSSSSLIMAALVASSPCSQSILSGLLAGRLVAQASERLLYWCVFQNVPATMTSLLSAGGVGSAVAVVLMPVAPLLRYATSQIRFLIASSVTQTDVTRRCIAGACWGLLSCYGSKIGYYHALHLPLILIEMELGDASFLGAIDELTLVLVSAGICCGNLCARCWLSTTADVSDADFALCLRGLRINLLYGDFIEVCYPFMERSTLANQGGYVGSAMSCAWLVAWTENLNDLPKSLAYLPLPVSVLLAGENWYIFLYASFVAFGVPLAATLLSQARVKRHR